MTRARWRRPRRSRLVAVIPHVLEVVRQGDRCGLVAVAERVTTLLGPVLAVQVIELVLAVAELALGVLLEIHRFDGFAVLLELVASFSR